METKFTKGSWIANYDDVIASTDPQNLICTCVDRGNGYEEFVYNTRLIAAAPDGYKAAETAYLAMMNITDYNIRLDEGFQLSLCLLRNFIAKATDRTAEEVQNEFEAKARGEQS